MRKEADFAIDERIFASFETADEGLAEMIFYYLDKIKQEVLIKKLIEVLDQPVIEREIEVGDSFIKVKFQSKNVVVADGFIKF